MSGDIPFVALWDDCNLPPAPSHQHTKTGPLEPWWACHGLPEAPAGLGPCSLCPFGCSKPGLPCDDTPTGSLSKGCCGPEANTGALLLACRPVAQRKAWPLQDNPQTPHPPGVRYDLHRETEEELQGVCSSFLQDSNVRCFIGQASHAFGKGARFYFQGSLLFCQLLDVACMDIKPINASKGAPRMERVTQLPARHRRLVQLRTSLMV